VIECKTVEGCLRMSRLRSDVRRFLRHGGDAVQVSDWAYVYREAGRVLSQNQIHERCNQLDRMDIKAIVA